MNRGVSWVRRDVAALWNSYDELIILALPTLGLSAALSLVTTYLPLTLQRYTSSATMIGFALGTEGIFAIGVPVVVGFASDHLWTRYGRRRPFMVIAAPLMAIALASMPFWPRLLFLALAVLAFFAAYHFYMSPYQALIPELVPISRYGRVQGFQTLMRGLGMVLGIVVTGAVLGVWEPMPYLGAAVLMLAVTYLTVSRAVEPPRPARAGAAGDGFVDGMRDLYRSTARERNIQLFLLANYLWESTVAALRTFIILYVVYVLGLGSEAGGLILGMVGVVYLVAGMLVGFLADRVGRWRVMWAGLWVYLVGCVFGTFVRDWRLGLLMFPVFGMGGSVVLTLPYSLLMGMMPRDRLGQFTGLFNLSRGVATITAPVVTGAVIDLAAPYMGRDLSYSVIWPLSAVAVGASMWVYRSVWRREGPRDGLSPGAEPVEA